MNLRRLGLAAALFALMGLIVWQSGGTKSVSATNEVSVTSSAELKAALASDSPVAGGGRILMAAGIYDGCFTADVSGTQTSPVILSPQLGQRAVIDKAICTYASGLNINGSDFWLWGVEVTDSNPNRVSQQVDSNPTDLVRGNTVNVYGARDKIINAYIHEGANGIGLWGQATDTEVYGTITSHNGWVGPENRGYGHGIYTQNETGVKQFSDSFVLDNYNMGFHAYSTAGYVVGVHVDGLVIADNGRPASGGTSDRGANVLTGTEQNPADDVVIANSVLYQAPGTVGGGLRVGYGVGGKGVQVTGNYVASGAQGINVNGWQQAQVTGNTVYSTTSTNPNASPDLGFAFSNASVSWNANTYYDATNGPAFAFNGSDYLNWAEWRSKSGYDGSSSYTTGKPPDKTIVQPNRYEPGRSNVIVLNWSRQPSTTVDLPGLATGQAFQVRDARNPLAVLMSGTYSGPVALPTPDEFNPYFIVPTDQPVPTTSPSSSSSSSSSSSGSSESSSSSASSSSTASSSTESSSSPETTTTIAPTPTTQPKPKCPWWRRLFRRC